MDILEVFKALSTMTPVGVMAMLAYVIYLQVKNQKNVEAVSSNHLSGLPDMEQDLREIKMLLQAMNDNIIYIRAKINAR